MLKLRTVYLYGLNDRIKDKDQCKSNKECEDLIGKPFRITLHKIQRDNNAPYQNRKGEISLNHKSNNLNISLNMIYLTIISY